MPAASLGRVQLIRMRSPKAFRSGEQALTYRGSPPEVPDTDAAIKQSAQADTCKPKKEVVEYELVMSPGLKAGSKYRVPLPSSWANHNEKVVVKVPDDALVGDIISITAPAHWVDTKIKLRAIIKLQALVRGSSTRRIANAAAVPTLDERLEPLMPAQPPEPPPRTCYDIEVHAVSSPPPLVALSHAELLTLVSELTAMSPDNEVAARNFTASRSRTRHPSPPSRANTAKMQAFVNAFEPESDDEARSACSTRENTPVAPRRGELSAPSAKSDALALVRVPSFTHSPSRAKILPGARAGAQPAFDTPNAWAMGVLGV